MNSLLAPGLHPFSPHFSPQKSGKPETFSVKLQTMENLREFCPSTHLFGRSIGASLCTDPSAHYGRWPLPTAILLIALLCPLSKNLLCQLSPPLKETKTRSVWQRKNVLNIKLIRLQSRHFWSYICRYSPLSVESPFFVVAAFPIVPALPLSTRYKV